VHKDYTAVQQIEQRANILSSGRRSRYVELVGAAGFEPTTTTTPRWCATRLRYAPHGIKTNERLCCCYVAAIILDQGQADKTAFAAGDAATAPSELPKENRAYFSSSSRKTSSSSLISVRIVSARSLSIDFGLSMASLLRAPLIVNPST
jgi:hypothetical protein